MDLADRWRTTFLTTLRRPALAEPLRRAARTGKSDWTQAMTDAVVAACTTMGWEAAARNHIPDRLPVPRSEYLAIDVMAFEPGDMSWPLPVAVMELENQQSDDYIAYDLWKLLCVRAELRCLFCYRPQAEQGRTLAQHLNRSVIAGLPIDARISLGGDTLLVIGSHADVATFPYGFFRWWLLDTNTGHFERR